MRTFVLGLMVLGLVAVTSCPPAQYDGAGQLLPTAPQPDTVTIIVPGPTQYGAPLYNVTSESPLEIENRPYGGLYGGPYGSLLGAPR